MSPHPVGLEEVCDVVFERKQFSFTHDGKHDRYWEHMDNVFDRQAVRIAEAVAISALDGDKNRLDKHPLPRYIRYHRVGRITIKQ